MIYLNEHFFGFTDAAEYFSSNEDILKINNRAKVIGLAYYEFYFDKINDQITQAHQKTDNLVVYIKEPFSEQLVTLVNQYVHCQNIKFFGDAVLNVDAPNWKPAVSWFVSPRHYYQVDNWAKQILEKINYSESQKEFYFDCLLGTKKPHRDFVDNSYQQSPYKDRFIFNYFKDDIARGIWNTTITEVNNTWEPITYHDQYEYRVALSAFVPYYIYNQSYHSIVAESTSYNKFNHITEKVAKPIMAQRIFVVFAGQYYLRSLQLLGFQTFSDIIDESYDLESDNNKRFALAWAQVEYLCTQDPIKVRQQVKKILLHNRELFLSTDWHHLVKQHIQQCLID